MQITDEVIDVVFRNEENGYSVLKLGSGVSAVGFFPYVSCGQEFVFTGEYVNNAKYGKQFKVESFELVTPNTPLRIKQFIGSGLIEGVGPVTAAKIVKTFGKDTLAIMEFRPEELTVVKGISLRKARIIGERFAEVKQMQHALSFLQRFEISLNMAIKVYNYYKERTVGRVQENPYALIETIDGIGFLTADKIAKELGINYAGRFRVRAGIVYVLKQSAEADGNTWLPQKTLFASVCRLLKIKTEQLQPVFDDVVRELCLDKYLTGVKDGYMLTKFFIAEKAIGQKLSLLANPVSVCDSFTEMVNHYEQMNAITLHEKQRQAILAAVENGVSVITGGPGTGKTTIIKAILYINEAEGKTTQLLAPTGRAAKRLEEATGFTASTIHRALDIEYGGKDSRAFTYDNEDNYLKSDMVIIDEVSMVDVILMNQVLRKIMRGTKLVLVGDSDQLPSVGAGSVLADIISSGVLETVRLTEIYRQTELSKIVTNAHAINRGEMPDLSNKSTDFFFQNAALPADIKREVVSLVSARLPKFLGDESGKIQVLCPMKLGDAGMNSLNLALQEALNPHEEGKSEYEYGQTVFRLGDRVMQTVNNYNQEWTRKSETGTGIFNGDIGFVTAINRQNGEVTVTLEDGRITIYTRVDLANLVLAYAITVHKSQGCEFDAVVIPVVSGAYMVLTRNLLYTAVTRARRMVVLVGSAENIKKMVENTYTQRRHTQLEGFLREESEKIKLLLL